MDGRRVRLQYQGKQQQQQQPERGGPPSRVLVLQAKTAFVENTQQQQPSWTGGVLFETGFQHPPEEGKAEEPWGVFVDVCTPAGGQAL